MKRVLLAAALLLALSPAEEEISYGLEAGTTLRRAFEAEAEYETTAEVWVDGEEVDLEEQPDRSLVFLERVVVDDEVLEAEEGFPTDFRRTFVELSQEYTFGFEGEEVEAASVSDLEDLTLRFLWDDVDERWYAELVDEDDDVSSDVLEWLSGDMDLIGFLPGYEVEEGEDWEVDGRAYLPLMWPSGLVGWYDEENEDGPGESQAEQNRARIENLEGEGTATLEEVRDEDGVRVAVISVELEVSSESEHEPEEGVIAGVEMQRELEGEVLWNLDDGHLHSASFTADSTLWYTREFELLDAEERAHDIEEIEVNDGTITYTVSVTRE